jgi:hypothetical protein
MPARRPPPPPPPPPSRPKTMGCFALMVVILGSAIALYALLAVKFVLDR